MLDGVWRAVIDPVELDGVWVAGTGARWSLVSSDWSCGAISEGRVVEMESGLLELGPGWFWWWLS